MLMPVAAARRDLPPARSQAATAAPFRASLSRARSRRARSAVRTFPAQGFVWGAAEPRGPVSDDRELVRRVAAADTAAFAALYDRYVNLIYGICRRIVGDPVAAEDVTQSVFLTLWSKPHAFTGGSLTAWLARVARNAALDVVRSAAVRTREPDMPVDLPAAIDVEEEVVSRVQATAVSEALRRLPAEQREAIEQAYFGGLSYREVAERSGTPLGTVKSRIRSGLRQLWEALSRQVTAP
jgi:RNA polymerase sigma-70 factor (ECF subfamily)